MSKKGLLLYWIPFIVIGAIGIVLVSTNLFEQEYGNIGKWQVNFLEETFLKAEVDLLINDITAKNAVQEVILLLAKSGGLKDSSECGSVNGKNLWNKGQKWCIPVVKDVASVLVSEKTKLSNVKFVGQEMTGLGKDKTIIVPGEYIQNYTYSTNVALNIGYSFDDYAQIEQEARRLVKDCTGKNKECVQPKLESHWKLCGDDIFCVVSPNKYVIKGIPIVYVFALDLS